MTSSQCLPACPATECPHRPCRGAGHNSYSSSLNLLLCLSQGDRMSVPPPAQQGQQHLQIQFTPAGTAEQGGPISGSSQVSRKCSKRGPVLTANPVPWALSFPYPGWPVSPCGGQDASSYPLHWEPLFPSCTHHGGHLPGQSWVAGASALHDTRLLRHLAAPQAAG